MKKVEPKASEPPTGSATREGKGAEKDSPALELVQARADSWDQSNSLPPVHPVLSLQRSIGNRAVGHLVAARDVQRESDIPSNSHAEPLDNPMRDIMGSPFSADFSHVRVHHDAPAGAAAENISANAFTAGDDIYFAPGKYAPNQSEGRRLLAHELARTVQQTQGLGPTKLARQLANVSIGHPYDPLEQEADTAVDRALALSTPAPHTPDGSLKTPASATRTVQRDAAHSAAPAIVKIEAVQYAISGIATLSNGSKVRIRLPKNGLEPGETIHTFQQGATSGPQDSEVTELECMPGGNCSILWSEPSRQVAIFNVTGQGVKKIQQVGSEIRNLIEKYEFRYDRVYLHNGAALTEIQ